MAIFTYGATNARFSDFDAWSNPVRGGGNVDLSFSGSTTDLVPAAVQPLEMSEIYNRSWFYGNVHVESGGGGEVEVTAPYSSGKSTGTIAIKNVDYSVHTNVILVATATYPSVFQEWRTADGGGGSQISTNATLTLTVADQTSTVDFYAYFS